MFQRKIVLFLFFAAGFFQPANSQIAPGQWREMLPYYVFKKIIPADNNLYCPSGYSLMIYDCNDQSYSKLSKINGLSEVGISAVAYSAEKKCFIIGYLSSNIDVVKGKEIINFPDIKNKLGIGNKTIQNITAINNYAYICCSFGIVVMDLDRLEIKDTYYIGNGISNYKVYDICIHGADLYAATEKGIFSASYDNPYLGNYANWIKNNSLPYPDSTYTSIKSFSGNLYAVKSGAAKTLYVYNGTAWTVSSLTGAVGIQVLDVMNDHLLIVNNTGAYVYNTSGELFRYYEEPGINYAVIDKDGTFWMSKFGSIVRIENQNTDMIYFGGPLSAEAFGITARDGITWISHGGCLKFNFLLQYSITGISVNSPDGWILSNKMYNTAFDSSFDFILTAVHPSNSSKAYAAALYGKGLYELNQYGKVVNIYTAENSGNAFQANLSENGFPIYKIAGLSFDSKNNLWISCQFSNNPLVVMKPDKSFKAFTFNGALNNIHERGSVLAASNGQKWILLGKGKGIFVFDDNNTIDDESDDTYKIISIKVSEVDNPTPYNDVRCIAEDQDGYIWLGTQNGPIIYFNPGDILTSEVSASRIKVPKYDGKNGASILLENETVNGIAVDGGNRKWLATANSGAFLVSPDGKKQIFNFREETSQIFSNTILDVAVDNKTGEVFFGSSKGVSVYRGDAAEAGSAFGKIYAFPNPVREDFEGEIIVTGLVANTNVKITDISGNLVYETTSKGSQASWNGKTFSGQRVHTGVYLIFCATPDGSQTHITKLLFIH